MRFLSCAMAAVALAALAAPSTASAKHSQFTIFQATREVRSYDPAVRAEALDEIAALGVRWLRVSLYWQDVAPAVDATAVPGDRRDRPGVLRLGGSMTTSWPTPRRVTSGS